MYTRLKYIITLSQFFGLLPINGVFSKNEPKKLQFKWFSLKIIYTIICECILLGISLMSIYHLLTHAIRLRTISVTIFYTNSLLSNFAFLNVAKKLPTLMTKWYRMEVEMRNYKDNSIHINKRVKSITFVFFTLALLEQLFSMWRRGKTNDDDRFSLELWVKNAFYFLFKSDPSPSVSSMSTYLNLILLTINFVSTYTWTFNDVFVMIISNELAERYKQINHKIEEASERQINCAFYWEKIRVDYNRLYLIYEDLNTITSSIVLISFTNSYYFILENFYATISLKQGFVENFYFYLMFALLIGRTLGLISFTASVNAESSKSLKTLVYLSLPNENLPLERLIHQVARQKVAITGLNLFYVTKRSYLRILGTIISYQLLLYQFKMPF